MILSAIAARLKRRSKDDFKGRHYEAALIDSQGRKVQAVFSLVHQISALIRDHALRTPKSICN